MALPGGRCERRRDRNSRFHREPR